MTVLAIPVIASIVRSVIVGVACLPLSRWLHAWVEASSGRRRSLRIALSLLPLFIPELVTGFSWRITAAGLADVPVAVEALYAGLLLSRGVAVGIAVRLLWPWTRVSDSSLFVWKLLRPVMPSSGTWWQHWITLQMRGPLLPAMTVWSLATLITFQEFETAALLQINRSPVAWTVQIFDAQAAWQPLADSFRMLAGPMLFEALLLIPLMILLHRPEPDTDGPAGVHTHGAAVAAGLRVPRILALGCLGLMLSLTVLVPLFSNGRILLHSDVLSPTSMRVLRQSLLQTITSLGFAAAAAGVSLIIAGWCLKSRWRLIVLIPGLFGALVSSLSWLSAFQLSGMRALYDSWLPLLLGLVTTHLPRAALLVFLVRTVMDTAGLHCAELLLSSPVAGLRRRAAGIAWWVSSRRWLLALTIMTHWCFWDVTTVSILRPVDVEPVITRLYNEMHYGRTESLVMITAMACAVTPAAGLAAGVAWKAIASRRGRRQSN